MTHIIRITNYEGELVWTGYAERMPKRIGNWRTVLDLLLFAGDVHDEEYAYALDD